MRVTSMVYLHRLPRNGQFPYHSSCIVRATPQQRLCSDTLFIIVCLKLLAVASATKYSRVTLRQKLPLIRARIMAGHAAFEMGSILNGKKIVT